MSDLLRRYHACSAWMDEHAEGLAWDDYSQRCDKLQRLIDQLADLPDPQPVLSLETP